MIIKPKIAKLFKSVSTYKYLLHWLNSAGKNQCWHKFFWLLEILLHRIFKRKLPKGSEEIANISWANITQKCHFIWGVHSILTQQGNLNKLNKKCTQSWKATSFYKESIKLKRKWRTKGQSKKIKVHEPKEKSKD